MSDPDPVLAVALAAETIFRKWVDAYADLLIPAFDQGSVFGEALDSEDIVALSTAIAAWRNEEPRWTGVRPL